MRLVRVAVQVGAMEVGKLTFNNDVEEHFTVIDMEAKSRMGLLRDISYQVQLAGRGALVSSKHKSSNVQIDSWFRVLGSVLFSHDSLGKH